MAQLIKRSSDLAESLKQVYLAITDPTIQEVVKDESQVVDTPANKKPERQRVSRSTFHAIFNALLAAMLLWATSLENANSITTTLFPSVSVDKVVSVSAKLMKQVDDERDSYVHCVRHYANECTIAYDAARNNERMNQKTQHMLNNRQIFANATQSIDQCKYSYALSLS